MRVSVIIPVLNEGLNIAGAIERVRLLAPFEIIVVDGGSTDDTLDQADAADTVLTSERGRAAQQNAGAAKCSGDVLLFLHADCQLDENALSAIDKVLANSKVLGGCFRMKIDANGWLYRWVERGNDRRARWLGWMYGDQGLFVRRDVFESLGGFPDVNLMEDLKLVRQLRRAGKVRLAPAFIHTSARRWERHGIVRQTLRNWLFLLLAHCGVSVNWLAKFYPSVR